MENTNSSRVELHRLRKLISATHKRAVKHEDCNIEFCPICSGGVFVCADCGAIEGECGGHICTAYSSENIETLRKERDEALEQKDLWFKTHLAHQSALEHIGKANKKLLERVIDAEKRVEIISARENKNTIPVSEVPDDMLKAWAEAGYINNEFYVEEKEQRHRKL